MRVVVPYTGEWAMPETCEALRRAGIVAEFVDVSERDESYHELLSDLWAQCAAAGEDLCLVEHDIEIHEDVISQFERCPSPWCTFPYPGRPYKSYPVPILRVALGCVRFRAEFLSATAGVLDAMLPGASSSLRNPRHWRRCDSLLATALQRRGFRVCEHEPYVVHHHDYASETISTGWLPDPGAAPRQ